MPQGILTKYKSSSSQEDSEQRQEQQGRKQEARGEATAPEAVEGRGGGCCLQGREVFFEKGGSHNTREKGRKVHSGGGSRSDRFGLPKVLAKAQVENSWREVTTRRWRKGTRKEQKIDSNKKPYIIMRCFPLYIPLPIDRSTILLISSLYILIATTYKRTSARGEYVGASSSKTKVRAPRTVCSKSNVILFRSTLLASCKQVGHLFLT